MKTAASLREPAAFGLFGRRVTDNLWEAGYFKIVVLEK